MAWESISTLGDLHPESHLQGAEEIGEGFGVVIGKAQVGDLWVLVVGDADDDALVYPPKHAVLRRVKRAKVTQPASPLFRSGKNPGKGG
ncbi:MAG: hypothetical protein IPH31_18135 [Lewinellaceae bacterium]|nr:hypothetical protein [Lewinellaceae bacterium]